MSLAVWQARLAHDRGGAGGATSDHRSEGVAQENLAFPAPAAAHGGSGQLAQRFCRTPLEAHPLEDEAGIEGNESTVRRPDHGWNDREHLRTGQSHRLERAHRTSPETQNAISTFGRKDQLTAIR